MARNTSKFTTVAILLCVLAGIATAPVADGESGRSDDVIDVAIALDISGSMQPLTDAARLKLWEIVQELTLIEPTPTLRVALLSYGRNDEYKAGWLRLETDLTTDLDRVSERLFALESEAGGGEWVARVLQAALDGLSWTDSPNSLKLIFIVGNEPADQDPGVSFRDMADRALREGILVHAVFCGDPENEHADSWKELAELAQGQFAAIDHRAGTVVVETPVDAELAQLSASINATFLPLGPEGAKRWQNALEQDQNAAQLSAAAAASRALVKAGPLYSAEWDLVGALAAGQIDLDELKASDLPQSLRTMSGAELESYVQKMAFEREELRQRIAELGEQRQRYVAERMKANGLDDSRAFDTTVRRALRERLAEKGW